MLNKEEIVRLLKDAALDANEYWVTSGAAMVLYGIRDGSRKMVFSETVELFENWIEDEVVLLEGLPVVSINGMVRMKEKLGREKDLKDIILIKEYLAKC